MVVRDEDVLSVRREDWKGEKNETAVDNVDDIAARVKRRDDMCMLALATLSAQGMMRYCDEGIWSVWLVQCLILSAI